MIGSGRRLFAANLLSAGIAGATIFPAGADGQTSPVVADRQLQIVDSLVATEFAKDSIGSITVGVIAGSELVWTRSYGFADMKSRRPADRNTV